MEVMYELFVQVGVQTVRHAVHRDCVDLAGSFGHITLAARAFGDRDLLLDVGHSTLDSSGMCDVQDLVD